jgi:hypothetical protein
LPRCARQQVPNTCCDHPSPPSAHPLFSPPDIQRYNTRVTAIDKDAKLVTLATGETLRYGRLLSTLPLDVLLTWLGKPEWASGLVHSSSHIIGVGIRGKWWAAGRGRPRAQGGPQRCTARCGAALLTIAMCGEPPAPLCAPTWAPKASRAANRFRALPTLQPPRVKVLAVLSGGSRPLLSRHRVQQLRGVKLPAPRAAAAHALPWRRRAVAGRGRSGRHACAGRGGDSGRGTRGPILEPNV